MLTGAFSLMGSGRGVDSSSLPLTRVSVSMSTSPSLLPPRGLEAPLDILTSHEALIGPRLLRVEAGMKQLRERCQNVWARCLLLLPPLLFSLCDARGLRMEMDLLSGWRNANASEASTRSDFRMHAAASDCVTVETCRSAETLSLCRSCSTAARQQKPPVCKIHLPLSEATDGCGTGLRYQLVSVGTLQAFFLPLPPTHLLPPPSPNSPTTSHADRSQDDSNLNEPPPPRTGPQLSHIKVMQY